MGSVFAPNHKGMLLISRATKLDFLRRQIFTARNIRGNLVVDYMYGGLNYQIEHHLFPQICHVNYPAISPVMESTCREFGVRYSAHNSLWSAVRAHYRWLREMGQPRATLQGVGTNKPATAG